MTNTQAQQFITQLGLPAEKISINKMFLQIVDYAESPVHEIETYEHNEFIEQHFGAHDKIIVVRVLPYDFLDYADSIEIMYIQKDNKWYYYTEIEEYHE